jgi:hypothetical protein
MIARAGRSDGLQEPLPNASEGESSSAIRSDPGPPSETTRSAGTVALLGAFANTRDARWAASLQLDGNSRTNGATTPAQDGASTASLEQKIRGSTAYRSLSAGDRGVAEWILWRASLGDPQKRPYYSSKLQTLFDTPYVKTERPGASELAQYNNAAVDVALERERARGDVFKGQEEQLSANARLTTRVGFNGTRYQVDGRDPRSIVVKLKVHLTGKPEFVAKIRELEDSIEKAASTTGYTVDLEFVDKRGANVFDLKANPEKWPVADNWAAGVETLAHELHHLLGLDDRYDYIEAHANNKFLPVSERLYLFAIQMMKPPDPRGYASLMNDQFNGQLLSEDVCAVVQDRSKACLDARKEWDPAGLPAHDQVAH